MRDGRVFIAGHQKEFPGVVDAAAEMLGQIAKPAAGSQSQNARLSKSALASLVSHGFRGAVDVLATYTHGLHFRIEFVLPVSRCKLDRIESVKHLISKVRKVRKVIISYPDM